MKVEKELELDLLKKFASINEEYGDFKSIAGLILKAREIASTKSPCTNGLDHENRLAIEFAKYLRDEAFNADMLEQRTLIEDQLEYFKAKVFEPTREEMPFQEQLLTNTRVKTPEEALAFLTERNLSTVKIMTLRRFVSKQDVSRQIQIAQEGINWIISMGISSSVTPRVKTIISDFNGSVQQWVDSLIRNDQQ